MKLTVRTLSRALSRTLPTKAIGLFREDLVTAQRRDPAATSALEIALTYPGVHALWTHRVSHALWTRGARTPARVLSSAARALTGVDIHPEARSAAASSSTTRRASSSARRPRSATTSSSSTASPWAASP